MKKEFLKVEVADDECKVHFQGTQVSLASYLTYMFRSLYEHGLVDEKAIDAIFEVLKGELKEVKHNSKHTPNRSNKKDINKDELYDRLNKQLDAVDNYLDKLLMEQARKRRDLEEND